MTPGNRMMTEKSYLQNLVHSQFFPELGKKKEPKRYTFDLDLTRHRNPLKKKKKDSGAVQGQYFSCMITLFLKLRF